MEGVFTLLALVYSCFAVVDHVALQVFAVVGNVLTDPVFIALVFSCVYLFKIVLILKCKEIARGCTVEGHCTHI